MGVLLRLLAAVLAGIVIGIVATHRIAAGPPPFAAVRSGAWAAWPGSGTADADPYTRAVFVTDGRLPLASAVGLQFFASRDDTGRRLDTRCDYRVGGAVPSAQYWTLTLLDLHGGVVSDPSLRHGLTSSELTRAGDGGFAITIADRARPGNWLPSGGIGRFMLMLTLYDTPLTTALLTGGAKPPLPAIDRTTCR